MHATGTVEARTDYFYYLLLLNITSKLWLRKLLYVLSAYDFHVISFRCQPESAAFRQVDLRRYRRVK